MPTHRPRQSYRYSWVILVVLLFVLTGTLSSCKYTRLLTFKSQLQQFTTYFTFRSPYRILFNKPVLMTEDVLFVSRAKPDTIQAHQSGQSWVYTFEKVGSKSPDEQGAFLTYQLHFNQQQILETVEYPFQLAGLFSKTLVIQMVQSIGTARIDLRTRTLNLNLRYLNKTLLPSKEDLLEHLGSPSERQEANGTETWVYEYQKKQPNHSIYKTKIRFIFHKDQIQFISLDSFVAMIQMNF